VLPELLDVTEEVVKLVVLDPMPPSQGGPQKSSPPHPSPATPQKTPICSQLSGMHVAVELVQSPQESSPPQPSPMSPHTNTGLVQVIGTQVLVVDETLVEAAHLPQSSVPPQPSGALPQTTPCPPQVWGKHPLEDKVVVTTDVDWTDVEPVATDVDPVATELVPVPSLDVDREVDELDVPVSGSTVVPPQACAAIRAPKTGPRARVCRPSKRVMGAPEWKGAERPRSATVPRRGGARSPPSRIEAKKPADALVHLLEEGLRHCTRASIRRPRTARS